VRRAWHQRQFGGRKPVEDRTHPKSGEVFDSAAELERYLVLEVMQAAGRIRDLHRQVRFPLVLKDGTEIKIGNRTCVFTADFAYQEQAGSEWVRVIEDYKGFDEREMRLRRAVAEAIYGFRVKITGPAARVKAKRKPKVRAAPARDPMPLFK
jgi:hypothetical protein